ncbi:hypothetical protein [Zhenhengia yiwuensis]|uniref:hypothetical protein n=1 Tax=Zhenhengia yiwuensis TaxID=2763666 RepID=UPI002A756B96|nr:hypothetical protein [Zhenhengia yiwuensis]MDY3368287.1 hypothetical protein [Zhenhengia yiwuensis]
MNYAYPTDNTYVTHQKSLKKTPLSAEAKERRAYIRSHKFAVDIDAKTQRCTLIVTEKRS